MSNEFVRWLPLFAAIVGGLFAINQIRINNITNARIKWLDNLKTLLTDFFSESIILIMEKGIEKEIDQEENKGDTNERAKLLSNKIFETTLDRLKLISAKHDLIRLNLNPKEALHIKFEAFLNFYMGLINKIPITTNHDYFDLSTKMERCSENLLLLSRLIMKLEWEKTKRGFLYRFYLKFGKGKTIMKEAMKLDKGAD